MPYTPPPPPRAGSADTLAPVYRFRDHARAGKSAAASSGERVAHKLAKALHSLGDDLMLLDLDSIEGACTLLRLAAGPFATDSAKRNVYLTLRQCAGYIR
jgi:hypothetical protein